MKEDKTPATVEESLSKLVTKFAGPLAAELGKVIGDQIRAWRVINQVKILKRVEKCLDEHQIDRKVIPYKLLVPLLDYASLDDSEQLQEKWSNMIFNMIDSDKNFQNHIFPYILSQISIEDFNALQEIYTEEMEFEPIAARRNSKLGYLNSFDTSPPESDQTEFETLNRQFEQVEQNGFNVSYLEAENLIRLGVLRLLPPPIYIEPFKSTMDGIRTLKGEKRELFSEPKYVELEAQYMTIQKGYRITELGKQFIEVCELKFKSQSS